MRRKFMLILTIVIIISVLLSNLTPLKLLFSGDLIQTYHFRSGDGSFTFAVIPAKGRSCELMEKQKKQAEIDLGKSIKLYRTFKIKPLQFWNWGAYLFSPIWKYPYLDPVPQNS